MNDISDTLAKNGSVIKAGQLAQESRKIELFQYQFKTSTWLTVAIILNLIFLTAGGVVGAYIFFMVFQRPELTQSNENHKFLITFTVGWFAFVSLCLVALGKSLIALTREWRISAARHYLVDLVKVISLDTKLSSQDLIRLIELGIDQDEKGLKSIDPVNTPTLQIIEALKNFKGTGHG